MKNVAIWVIVGIVAANFIAARKSERKAEDARRAAERVRAEVSRGVDEIRETTRHRLVRIVNGKATTEVDREDDDEKGIHIRWNHDNGQKITVARDMVLVEGGDDTPAPAPERKRKSSFKPFDPPKPPAPPAPPAPPKPARAKKPTQQLADVPPPAWLPKTEAELQKLYEADDKGFRVLAGKVSASPEKARDELRKALEQEVGKWASPDVPTDWRAPRDIYDAMTGEVYIQPIAQELEPGSKSPENLYVVYRGIAKADFSDASRERVVDVHQQQRVTARLVKLGGGLGFVLICLGFLTGYVRTDEATKGYYTNRLRVAAAIGAGVAGTVIYQMLA